MKASIFIPTGNRAESLGDVLESLTKQTCKDLEVLIVDYKSTDATFKVIDLFKKKLNIILIHQQEKGLSKAGNLALQKASGDIFIRTDDDVIMSPGWLEAIVQTFKDTKVGGVTGPTVIPKAYLSNRDLFSFENKFKNGNFFWKTIGKIYYGYFMEGEPYRVSHWFQSGAFGLGSNFPTATKQKLQEINNLEACNFSVRTDLLRKVGGFDPSYTGVGEYHEADAAFKIQELGYKLIYNPKAYLNHCPSQDGFFNDRPESYSRMINFIVFYLRHIKPNTWSKFFRFISYIFFLDCYYIFQFLKTGQSSQLGALTATFVGPFSFFRLQKLKP